MKLFLDTLIKKWPEYLLESIVIFGSILGAISMENWNEERKERAFEQKMLAELQVSLTRDIRDLNFNIKMHKEAMQSQRRIIEWLDSDENMNDSLCYDFGKSNYWTVFIRNSGTYETLKSTGITLITNDSLRKAISYLYEMKYDFHDEIESQYNSMLKQKWEAIDDQFFSNSFVDSDNPMLLANCMQPTNLTGLRSSNPYRYNLENMIELNQLFIREMEVSKNRATRIIEIIDNIYNE